LARFGAAHQTEELNSLTWYPEITRFEFQGREWKFWLWLNVAGSLLTFFLVFQFYL